MEGPGGYQFVGRTVPVWDRWGRRRPTAEPERPWLLRFFDQIQWYEVEADELLELRADVESGRFEFDVTETTFSVADHLANLERNAQSIEAFTQRRNAAFDQERLRWAEAGIDVASTVIDDAVVADTSPVADGEHAVVAPVSGVVWRLDAAVGDQIGEGQSVATIEAMKMETSIPGSVVGVLTELRVEVGDVVQAGDIVAAIKPHGGVA
jgi:urea carboxylase